MYLSIAILDELVRFVEEDSSSEDFVKAMTPEILSYYFPVIRGYIIAPEKIPDGDSNFTDSIILRIQRRFPGDRSIIDHTLVEAKRDKVSLEASLEQFHNALEHANTEFGRCWALMVQGAIFQFYEYHQDLPENDRLVPWGPPDQQETNTFHARRDNTTIDWILRHMASNETPPAR